MFTAEGYTKEKIHPLNSCVMLLGTQKQLKTLQAIEAWKHYSLIVITSTLKSSQKKQITCTSPQNETILHKDMQTTNTIEPALSRFDEKNLSHCK